MATKMLFRQQAPPASVFVFHFPTCELCGLCAIYQNRAEMLSFLAGTFRAEKL
jgi:hypothetical protein